MNFEKNSNKNSLLSSINTNRSLYLNCNRYKCNSTSKDYDNHFETSGDDDDDDDDVNISENSLSNKLDNLKLTSNDNNNGNNCKYYQIELIEDDNYCIIDTSI